MTWHPVANRSELARPGDYLVLPWKADGEIALTNIDGEIVAFDNRCPHRGARIFTDMRGNRPPVCGYHGRCARAEQMQRFQAFAWGDWIIAESNVDFPLDARSYVGGMDLLRDLPPLALHGEITFVMDCDWTVAIENALDFEHVAHLHGNSLARLALQPGNFRPYADGSSMQAFKAESLRRMDSVFPHQAEFDYVHAHLFPQTCISSTRGWTYSLQHYFPRADGRTNFVHRLYSTPTTRPVPGFFDAAFALNRKVFEEDAAICANVPAGHAGALGPLDARIAHFRSHL